MMVDLAVLSSILGWSFVGGLGTLLLCFVLTLIFLLLTQYTDNTKFQITSGALLVVTVIISHVARLITIFGGLGWFALWVYTVSLV